MQRLDFDKAWFETLVRAIDKDPLDDNERKTERYALPRLWRERPTEAGRVGEGDRSVAARAASLQGGVHARPTSQGSGRWVSPRHVSATLPSPRSAQTRCSHPRLHDPFWLLDTTHPPETQQAQGRHHQHEMIRQTILLVLHRIIDRQRQRLGASRNVPGNH